MTHMVPETVITQVRTRECRTSARSSPLSVPRRAVHDPHDGRPERALADAQAVRAPGRRDELHDVHPVLDEPPARAVPHLAPDGPDLHERGPARRVPSHS